MIEITCALFWVGIVGFSPPSRNTLIIYPPHQKKNFIFEYEYEKPHVSLRLEKLEKDKVTKKKKIHKQKEKRKKKNTKNLKSKTEKKQTRMQK